MRMRHAAPLATPRRSPVGIGKRGQNAIRVVITYVFLSVGALFMLFPVFWMLTVSFKPTWQISAPDILLPSQWYKARAGSTTRLLNLWTASTGNRTENVIMLGSKRQYVTLLRADSLKKIAVVPRSEVPRFEVFTSDDFQFNGFRWQGQEYILVGSEGTNVLAIKRSEVSGALILPKTQLRTGQPTTVQIGEHTIQARQIKLNDGSEPVLVEAGPTIELNTILPASYASQAILASSDALQGKARFLLGNSEVDQYTLKGSDQRYVLLEQGDWHPVISMDILQQFGFSIDPHSFTADAEPGVFNGGVFRVGTYTNDTGEKQKVAVVVYAPNQAKDVMLVLPLQYMDKVQLILNASIIETLPEPVHDVTIQLKDFAAPKVEEEQIDLKLVPTQAAVIGERQSMALLLPVKAISQVYDVFNDQLQRKLSPFLQLKNYIAALGTKIGGATFLTFFKNSALVSGLSIIGHLLSCTIVAYAFARLRAPGKNVLFGLVLATMMLPGFITVIPVYTIFRDLKMIDTLWPMFIRSFFGNAFLIFLLRQFFMSLPVELEEAAYIDGATHFQTFRQIMLPMIVPALATVIIFTFLWSWNNLFDAALYLNSPENYTVPLGLANFVGLYTSSFNLLMPASTIAMLPTVLLFFFAQRFFIEGIALTGIKG